MSRKIEDLEYVEASTSAATVLPGVPLPAWTHLGEPEPEPTPEPEPAPEPASVMERVSVGAAVERPGHAVGQTQELSTSVPAAPDLAAVAMSTLMPAAPQPSMPEQPPVSMPAQPSASMPPMAPVAAAGLISVVGASVPDSLDAFAPSTAIVPDSLTAFAPPTALPAVPVFAAPVAPAPSFAPPVPMVGSEVSMLAGAVPAPEAFAPPAALPSIPAPPPPAPDLAAPIAGAPLLMSPPAPLVTSPVAGPATTADAAPEQAVGDMALDAAPMGDPTTDADADAASDGDLDATATRSRRPLVLLLVVGILAILGAVAAFVYPGLLVSHDDPAPVAPVTQQQPKAAPKTATLAVPATVAGLDTISGAPATALSAAASSTALAGFSTPVSAVYGKAGVPGATVIAWTAAPSSPAANIASAFAGFETASATAITDIAEVPVTGGLTGQMSCGNGTVNAAPATVCFWADDTTFGAVTILKPATAKDGALTAVAVRQAVETLA